MELTRNHKLFGLTMSFVFVVILYSLDVHVPKGYRFLPAPAPATAHNSVQPDTQQDLATTCRENVPLLLQWTNFFVGGGWFDKKTTSAKGWSEYRCSMGDVTLSYRLTQDRSKHNVSDVVLLHWRNTNPSDLPRKRPGMKVLMMSLESPPHSYPRSNKLFNHFDWISTYRPSSDVYIPYQRIVSLKPPPTMSEVQVLPPPATPKPLQYDLKAVSKKVALEANRTKMVLWFMSNCGGSARNKYTAKLKKSVSVDIFGACGKPDPCKRKPECIGKLALNYRFYLGFENSLCSYYMTEKMFFGFKVGLVPILMGATREEYAKMAPPNSFIHVDDFKSHAELAKHLKFLSNNSAEYAKYHAWRDSYSVVDNDWAFYQCRLRKHMYQMCLLGPNAPNKVYGDINLEHSPKLHCH